LPTTARAEAIAEKIQKQQRIPLGKLLEHILQYNGEWLSHPIPTLNLFSAPLP
jgi:hypothetical protein